MSQAMDLIGAEPMVSLVMVVKDGMPYVKDALASVAAQTYRNFELVVQDGASTDGTLDMIHAMQDLANVRLESVADGGPAIAFNQVIHRCNGDIIGSIFADDLLEPDALEKVVAAFREHPEAAVIYGGCKSVDEQGEVVGEFQPNPFNLLQLMSCKLVPPFSASFFSRPLCGDYLYFDADLITELGFWLRVSHLPIVKVDHTFSCVRASVKSRTFQPDFYDRICHDKIRAVEQYLAQFQPSPPLEQLRQYCMSGVYTWAAESMQWLPEGTTEQFNRYFDQAEEVYPYSDRLKVIRLTQILTQAQQDYTAATNLLQQTQTQLGETQTLLQQEQSKQEAIRAEYQQATVHLQATIAAMESSKFWQIRTQWLKLRDAVVNRLKR